MDFFQQPNGYLEMARAECQSSDSSNWMPIWKCFWSRKYNLGTEMFLHGAYYSLEYKKYAPVDG